MSLTNGQKRAIHCAAREAGIDSRTDEDSYRLVLWNVGGFHSAADRTASRQGFIAVMAFFEQRAGGGLTGCTFDYWADEDAKANPRDPIIYRIKRIAAGLGMDDQGIEDFMESRHMSSGAYRRLEDAPTRWLVKLLEALKAMQRRRGRTREYVR